MELVSPSATTTPTPPPNVDSDVAGATGASAQHAAHGPARARRQFGHRGGGRPRRPVLRDPPPGRVVLRHARGARSARSARTAGLPDHRVARARVRRADPPHRVWLGFLRHLNGHHGLPGEARGARRDDLGRAAAPRATALQPGRLHLRRAGRDDEPPHQPVLLRPRGARRDVVQRDGRHGVVGHRVALRPHLLERGRPARPGLGPPDPARPRPSPAAGGRRHRHGRGGHPDPGPVAQTRPGPRRPDRGGIAPRAAVVDRGRPQRRA